MLPASPNLVYLALRMRSISFNPAMVTAVWAGRKTVTRRRFPSDLPFQQQPGRYRYHGLTAAGALFEDLYQAVLLPPVPCPFGQPGDVLQVQEAPALLLQVESIRAEQVRDVTAADARAEGIFSREQQGSVYWGGVEPAAETAGDFLWYNNATAAFRGLFESIYPTTWARNEWVWVVAFVRVA